MGVCLSVSTSVNKVTEIVRLFVLYTDCREKRCWDPGLLCVGNAGLVMIVIKMQRVTHTQLSSSPAFSS